MYTAASRAKKCTHNEEDDEDGGGACKGTSRSAARATEIVIAAQWYTNTRMH